MTDKKRLAEDLVCLGLLMKEQARKQHTDSNCSPMHFHALAVVKDLKQPTMRELAESLALTPSAATTLVGKLIRQKLVRRLPDPSDRRITRLSLTASGTNLLQARLDSMARWLEHLVSPLTSSEQKDLIRLIERLVSNK